jgi:oxygen-independent coproporphyrinogen-3 oxidase
MTAATAPPAFDSDLIRRYDKAGPRYTSYPTAAHFNDRFSEAEYRDQARATNEDPIPRPLSLYFHIPFCATVCYYCACNKIVTGNRSRAADYLQYLYREIALQGELFDRDRLVEQLHWGGGTPTFLDHAQMREVMSVTGEHFLLRNDDGGEYSIEIDPRGVEEPTIALLRDLGFNRISIGVQDFDAEVQKAVNRIQSREQTAAVIDAAKRHGFKSVNMDLIYGLPLQTPASFGRTLDAVIATAPDRLSIFNYAHLPERFKTQRQINEADLPSPADKLKILQTTIERLIDAGYIYIGMDHFARATDELAVAQRSGTLCRNFQGYSTHGNCDLVGLGVSAISKVGNCYAQNTHDLTEYYQCIKDGRLAIKRGVQLNRDDLLRRDVISELICLCRLDIRAIENKWGIHFVKYFEDALPDLEIMMMDGLVRLNDGMLEVLPPGRLLIRNICMIFDAYLTGQAHSSRYSRTI